MFRRSFHNFFITVIITLTAVNVHAQQIDLNDIKGVFGKGKALKLSGGMSANSGFYGGNGGYIQEPFTYALNGNLNINILGKINLPFAYSLTNSGRNFNYPTPPNRLSIHPNYKWIQGHIGDAAMSFSPYTLSSHPFTGAGLELSPKGPWKLSMMYGRLQRAVEYDSLNRSVKAAYRRMGYGGKVSFEKERYKVGVIVFQAKDEVNSLKLKPDSLQIRPMENLAASVEVGVKPIRDFQLNIEYATSVLTNDVRALPITSIKKHPLKELIQSLESTSFYNAIKGQLNYTFKKNSVGMGYERIDPGYRTLGAYYFNNDLENITINLTQTLLKDKINLAFNIGLQHDDIDNTKANRSSRTVGSLNMNYNVTTKLNLSLYYSNFQSYTNVKPQFQDDFNPNNPDSLNYTQLSQDASLNINYLFNKNDKKQQNLNINLSMQDAADKQGGVLYKGNGSQFYNLMAAYTINFVPKQLTTAFAFNVNYNTIGRNNSLSWAPTMGVNAKLLKKKVNAGLNLSYNTSRSDGAIQGSSLNLRYNMAYQFKKKHNLTFNVMSQFRKVPNRSNTNGYSATMGYGYSF